MPRPRKYANNAEKAKAFRLRRKLEENQHPPQLDQVAKMVHKLYKERAERGLIDPKKLVGKTPYETLLRVVVYDLLFERHLPDNTAEYELPPLDKLIIPALGIAPGLSSWEISPNGLSDEAQEHVWVYEDNEEDDEEDDEEGKG
jgi:hypothetical protein